jgi:DNA topoisomerase-1
VANFLSGHFPQYVDYDFTAKLEDELDAVSRGEEDWVPLLARFWAPFKALVDDKSQSVDRSEATGARVVGIDPKSGKPVTVRLGRYGPFAQIGTTEDGDKPTYASLRPGQSMHTIALADALELFKLPRTLGEDGGETVSVAIGRFGPFAKRGSTYASLKKEDDPYTIDLETAVARIREKEEIAANRLIKAFEGSDIQVLNGRYGPYVTDGIRNGRIPKDREPASLTLADCLTIMETAPPPKPGRGRGAAKKAPAKKAAAKKSANGAAAGTAAVEKAPAGKAPAKKAAAKKAVKKKPAAKKTAIKKAAAKRTAGKVAELV